MQKRKFEEADEVASHYNNRDEVTQRDRTRSPIIHLKVLNNCLKSVLINQFITMLSPDSTTGLFIEETGPPVSYGSGCKAIGVPCKQGRDGVFRSASSVKTTTFGPRVLDLCGGKGGDLGKYTDGRLSAYVLADFAAMSVEAARQRYNAILADAKKSKGMCPAQFVAMNLCDHRLHHYLHPDIIFDLVSCQFAFHYCFQSESNARRMLENATDRLRPGGFFIGTMPDSRKIVSLLRKHGSRTFGNDIYSVTFEERYDVNGHPIDWSKVDFNITQPFGIKYDFYLEDAVENVPEYLVHFPTLCALAAEYGLRPVLYENFETYFANQMYPEVSKCSTMETTKAAETLRLFNFTDSSKTMPLKEWEAIGVYSVFAFQKIGKHYVGDELVADIKQTCVRTPYIHVPEPNEAGIYASAEMDEKPQNIPESRIITPRKVMDDI